MFHVEHSAPPPDPQPPAAESAQRLPRGTMKSMTLAEPAVVPEAVVAAGRDGRGRKRLLAVTAASLVAAWLVWKLAGSTEAGSLAVMLLVLASMLCLALAVWRRAHSFKATPDGLRFQDGGKAFGETYLVGWPEVKGLGTQPTRGGKERLVYQRRGSERWVRLPTPPAEPDRAQAMLRAIEAMRG